MSAGVAKLGAIKVEVPSRGALPASSVRRPYDGIRLDAIFVLNSLALGGSEKKIVRLANRLQDQGAKIGLVYLNGPATLAGTLRTDIPLWALKRKRKVSLAAVGGLRSIVASSQPRTLIAVNLYPALYVAAAVAGAPAPRPVTVALVNTSKARIRDFGRRQFYRQLLRLLDRTVHGCDAQRTLWLARGSAAWTRSSVIYNGVDLEEFRPDAGLPASPGLRLRLGLPPGRFVFGSVGRLASEKNQAVLIETLARLRSAGVDAHLLLVGDGALRGKLERQVRSQGLAGQVSFAGAMSDVRPLLGLMDVFVLPSVESFSNAALEAMAMAKPVILTSNGGAQEMLRDGVEGHLVAPAELARRLPALLKELHMDSQRRARLGAAARARATAHFSIDAMIDRYRELIGVHDPERARV